MNKDISKMDNKKILILVKTYTNLSKKYGELVCTAGIDENGKWIRLHPIPFRKLNDYGKYHKYEYVQVKITKNNSDPRPESYRILNNDINNIKIIENSFINSDKKWETRKNIIFNQTKIKVYNNLKEIITLSHNNKISLVMFKPTKLLDVIAELNNDTEKYGAKINEFEKQKLQLDLFTNEEENLFKPMPFIDYKFSYKFNDINGKESTLQIIDWEIGQLYLNLLKKYKNKQEAKNGVIKKYKDEFFKKDIYLFLGTIYKQHIRKSKNPFLIIGVFYPPLMEETRDFFN
ncbi:MAG: hypothetical protein LBF97_07705 [Elusimicrobiota bacterium]|jgi:hypothetical protein|nr:hypothetical protein [Elusimicrobiota bacterium]